MDEQLRTLRKHISTEARYIGIRPYSHNIVRMTLRTIAAKFGQAEANKAVRDFKLISKGFNEEPVPTPES